VGMISHCFREKDLPFLHRHASQPDEQHAVKCETLPEDEFPETFVTSDQYRAVRICGRQHLLIRRVLLNLCHVERVVAVLPEPVNQRPINICIAEKLQAASSGAGYTASPLNTSAAYASAP
jgi:hypothetical protein